MAHLNYSITGSDIAAVAAAADAYIADSNAADFAGVAATSYEIFEVEGIYGTSFEAVFVPEFITIAGERFYSEQVA